MTASTYPSPNHFESHVVPALNAFEKALTFRWRDETAREAAEVGSIWTPNGNVDVDGTHQVSEPCKSMEWAIAGQQGPVTPCTSAPGSGKCQIQDIMERAPEWARDVRVDLIALMPMYDGPDLEGVEAAHANLVQCATLLGQNYTNELDIKTHPTTFDDLGTTVSYMDSHNASDEVGFWASWTGMASEAAKTSFFNSVGVTLHNQRQIVGHLAELYSYRASIIEAARVSTLTAITSATNQLSKIKTTEVDNMWKYMKAATKITSLAKMHPAVGVSVKLFNFLGDHYVSKSTLEEYSTELQTLVTEVKSRVRKANNEAAQSEGNYERAVLNLEKEVKGVPNGVLELYDFSKSSATGDPSMQRAPYKYVVTVEQMFHLADACFHAAELHQEPLRILIAADQADSSLTDMNGNATTGDTELIDVRDTLISFLQTSAARYHEAGRRVKDAAKRYAESDTESADQMPHLSRFLDAGELWDQWDVPEDSPDLDGDKTAGKGGSIADHLGPTDRSDIEDGKEGQPDDDTTDPDAPSHGDGQPY